MEKPSFLFSRSAEILAAIFLALALAGMQVLIGGTRLAFSLPIDVFLVVVGFLSLLVSRPEPAVERVALVAAAVFFSYILARAWFAPVPAMARVDIFSVLGGLVVYFFTACIFTGARGRIYLLLFLLVVALGQVVIGAIQFHYGDNFMLIPFLQRFDYGRRASGFYLCPNHFAGLLEVLAVFVLSIVFNDFADQKRVRLLRGSEARVFDVRHFRRDPTLDPRLQPGDRVEVPQSFF